jgi:predicted nuclease of predicted toxin-antitoxin system
MKISEYLQKTYDEDPEFGKWLKNQWLSSSPPKRKIRIFADASLPEGFVDEVNNYKAFKLVGKANNEKDPKIYKQAKRLKALLLTSDKDFWNDQVFPLSQSPGVVIIEGNNLKDVDYCFGYFLVYFGIIDAIRKIPTYPERMKFKISRKGFVIKNLDYHSKVNIDYLEY